MKSKIMRITSVVLIAFHLTSCANMTNEEIGGVAGAIAGIAVGSLIGDGGGQAAAIAIGGLVGAIAGASLGRELDEADRLRAELAAQRALESNRNEPVRWENPEQPESIYGTAEAVTAPVIRRKPITVAPDVHQVAEVTCRSVREVIYIEGKEQIDTVEYCREAGSHSWERQAA